MAQNNRLKYYISFEADTKKAKSQIDDMMRSLDYLNSPQKLKSDLPLTKELLNAHNEAAKLKGILRDALNVDTGRLDLSKFTRDLRQSGLTIKDFRKQFDLLGEEGVKSFTKITEAILQGEIPLKRQNALFDKMAETMRNTVRWQISATALNAFTTAINNAYRYAEDLNRSLNDIRIVTGQSVEQMDAFANKANAAARELRTTTKAYTDAALIFYQQGLEDDEVLERTNAVMKMANVTGENATQVSSYMTAIWNNFEDGSKSLEYYGDVITKLGAATAASSEEIAGGMEKFAAVADTVGLSYEYASAALATIIDQTRQSEDVVGTALRTIFARLSSLSLGETLEDGVDLTKYSKALDVVGVKILDQNDQLKSMDVILDELGAKWGELNGSQKQALATTVAGVRQYSQLIALMDNYDLFKVNVDLAIDSEGTLTEQAEIFEESWLGAQRRVTAALEGIYNQLLEDDIFIGLTNGLATVLEILDWIIERAGGLPAALSLAGIVIQKVFGKTIKDLFIDLRAQYEIFTGEAKTRAVALQKEAAKELTLMTDEAAGKQYEYNKALEKTAEVYEFLMLNAENYSDLTQEIILAQLEMMRNSAKLEGKLAEDALTLSEQLGENRIKIQKGMSGTSAENFKKLNDATKKYGNGFTYDDIVGKGKVFASAGELKQALGKVSNEKIKEKIDFDFSQSLTSSSNKQQFKLAIEKVLDDVDFGRMIFDKAVDSTDSEAARNYFKTLRAQKENRIKQTEAKDATKEYGEKVQETVDATNKEIKQVQQNINNLNVNTQQFGKELEHAFSSGLTGAMQLASGCSAAAAAFKVLGDESMSAGEKIGNFLTSAILAVTQLHQGLKSLKPLINIFTNQDLFTNSIQPLLNSIPFLQKFTNGAKSLIGVLWKMKLVIGLLSLAIAGVVYLFKQWDNSRTETKLKKATEATKELSKAASEAASNYKKIKDTLNSLDDSYNNIENLKQGTAEWKIAVQELNDSLSELIETYNLLYGDDWYYKNGVIVITDEGQSKIEKQETEKQETLNKAKTFQSIETKQLETKKAEEDLEKELKSLGTYSTVKNAQGYMQYENYGEYIGGVLKQNFADFGAFKKQIYANDYFKDFSEERLKELWNQYQNIEQKRLEINDSAMGLSSDLDLKTYNLTDEIDSDTRRQLEIQYTNDHKEQIANFNIKQAAKENNLNEEEYLKQYGYGKSWDGKYYELNDDGTLNTEVEKTKEEIESLILREILPSFIEWATPSKISSAIAIAKDEQYSKHYDLEELEEDKWRKEADKVSRDIKTADLDEKEIVVYKEHLIELTDGLKQFGNDSSKASQMLDRITVANMRFNTGLEDIIDNWQEYVTGLTEVNKGSNEYAQLMENLKQSTSELLDIEKESISDDFLLDNMNLFQEAAHGSIEALEQLRENAALAEIETLDSAIQNTEGVLRLKDWITSFNETWPDLEVGASLDTTNFDETIQKLLEVSGMTVEEMENILNDIGFEPVIEYDEVSYEDAQKYGGSVYKDVDGKKELVSNWEEETNLQGSFFIPKINASKTTYRGSPKTTINATNRAKAAGNASSRRQDMKKADDEIERYHLIKETIEDLNRELDRLSKEKDRAWGNAHLQYIDREIAKTEEAIDAQKEYLRQIEENYSKDRGALAAYGGQFDENGRLTNYEELMREQIAKYNAAVRSGSETQQETAEEQYNNFKKALEQYEETADLFESEYEQLLDLQNQFYDKLLERIQYKVEVDVQISEEADKYYDYILDMLEDKAYSAAEAIAYLGKKTDESLKRIASYQEALNSMFEMHGFGDDAYERFANGELSIEELATAGFTSQEIDMLIEYRGALMEENKQLMEMRDQVISSLTDTFDEYMDTLDKMIDKFDHLNAVTSAYKNIVDIVGKKALGISNDMLKAMDEATVATATNTLKASKDRLDAAEAAMADMEKLEADYQEAMANANKATSEDEKLYWLGEAQGISDAMEHIEEESRAAKEAFLGSWEEALTTAREVFENNVQLAMEEFEDAISGIYGSLDAMKEAYDQNKVLREQYLEEYERIYELNKLNRDITNSMDDVDSIAAKQTLRDLQEEINELQRSGAQISKYDLDMLRMRYELRLAEIALEDAQNAKSQVRMSRDNDGNWSYVYTADEGAVADAQQGYEDKMMAMQQSSNDYLNQMSEQWIAAEIEMEQAYQKIWEDRTLSDEERAAAIDRLYEYYGERFNFFNDQITNALGNNKILYEEDWLAWADKNNIQIESNDSFLTNFEDTVLGVTTGFDDVDTLHQELLDAVGRPGEGGYLGDLDEAYTDWQENVSDIMNAAGTSVTDFGDDFAEVAEDTVEDSAEMAEEVENMSETMKDAFEDVIGAVKDWRKEYSDVIAANIRQNSNMINSLASLLDRINKTIDAQIKLNSVTGEGPTSATGSYVGNTIDDDGTGGPGDGGKAWHYNGRTYSSRQQAERAVTNYIRDVLYPKSGKNWDEYNSSGQLERDSQTEKAKIQYYNTGGYTGAWGSSGRLAVLHEKELVLNKDDTANFLSAINIVRDIVKVVDMNAAISGMGIGALAASGIAGAGSTIEQSVTIYADFPNATDHSEIELALANLMNSASQYANRKG